MRIKLIVFLLIIFCSCNRKTSEQRSVDIFPVWIDLTTPSDSVISNLSSIASDIEYLPLKTTDRVSVFKIVASFDRIYIDTGLDLLCFNKEGDFCYKLSSSTADIEETFSIIDDFDISTNDSTLVIRSYNRLLIFNKTGTGFVFQNSIELKRPPPSLISLVPGSKNILLSYKPVKGSEPLLTLLINSDGDTLNYRINKYKYKLPLMLSERINHYKTGDYLCFQDPYSDTVFCIKKGLNYFKTRLILDSKGRTYNNWNNRKGIYVESEYNEYYSLERVFEFSDKIFYNNTVFYPGMTYPFHSRPFNFTRKLIYNPSTYKKTEIPMDRDLVDDIRGGPDFKPLWYSNGKLYTFIYVSALKTYIESEDYRNAKTLEPRKKEELRNLADSLPMTDNTILIIVTLKDNSAK